MTGPDSPVAELLRDLTPWQRWLTDRILDTNFKGFSLQCGRSGGRLAIQRRAIEWAAERGIHMHVACLDGSWCVTRQPIGYLWARLPKLREAMSHYAVDEDAQLVTRRDVTR